MTLPTSGPISMNDLATEYGVPNTTPLAGYIGKPGAPTGNPVSLEAFYGASDVVFTPNGGTVADSKPYLAQTTLSCTQSAVWTYSVTSGGTATSVSIASGASATSIVFQQGVNGTAPHRTGLATTWDVSATAAGVIQTWTVTLTTAGD